MKREIDKDFYCSADYYDKVKDGICKDPCGIDILCYMPCKHRHRKYPTPEQFKEEYGEEYPDDGAVYSLIIVQGAGIYDFSWVCTSYLLSSQFHEEVLTVCACTPFGKPDKDWRP